MITGAIIQARVGSTRLPGKVMKEGFPGRTLLSLMLERLGTCKRLDKLIVAVPESADNDRIADEARRCGVLVFRGSEADVLTRYVGAARQYRLQMVVRVTSDCPLIDAEVVDRHVDRMRELWSSVDFVTNMMRQSFALGLAVEAMPIDVLERMSRLSTTPYLREHVTTIAYEQPSLFAIDHVMDRQDRSHLRWTVDYPEDLEFVRAVFGALYWPGRVFSTQEVLSYLEHHPEVTQLNAHVGK
jgi:spore coat polysaccharide biosynthesis protein SpsF